ncbi:nuclear transport factor 2 family protein [Geodermatophilus sp. SYSU D00079]
MSREGAGDRLDRLYAAFAARDVAAVTAAMTEDVDWPNGWEGGRVVGRAAVADYWRRQWTQISLSVRPLRTTELPDGRVAVDVALVVRGPDGGVLSRATVRHVYAFRGDLVARMDVVPAGAQPPAP